MHVQLSIIACIDGKPTIDDINYRLIAAGNQKGINFYCIAKAD